MSDDEESVVDDDDEPMTDEDESEEEISDEEDGDTDYWREIIATACQGIEFEDPEDLLREPQLSHAVDAIRQLVENRLAFAAHIEYDNEVYERIKAEMDRLDGLNEDDAQEAAWHNKRFLIKRVLAENLDVLKEEDEEEENTM